MRQITFEPKQLEIRGEQVDNPFMGYLKLNVPTYLERIDLIRKMDLSEGGLGQAEKTIKLVYDCCKEVKLEFIESAEIFNDLDNLSCTEEGTALINAAGRSLLLGYQLGNR